MAAAMRFDLHQPRPAIARALVALLAASALGAAAAQTCYPGNATSGSANYDIRFSTSILNINNTNIRPKPKVLFNRYCFAVTGQAPCGAAEACCQAVSDAFRLTTASIKIDPKCIVSGLSSNLTFTLRNGSSTKGLVGWSLRKASKAAAATLRVALNRKAARGLTSLEVCVNLPVAPGLCSTLEALCGGAACSANLTTTSTRLKGQPKSKKLPCCISSSINPAAATCAGGSGGPSGTCQPCPAGTAGTGVLPTEACPPCGATSYTSIPGSPQCTQCPRGQAANAQRTGCVPLPTAGLRRITFTNNCPKTVWMMSAPNAGVSPLPGSPAQIATGQSFAFNIPSAGWAGRFWPKGGCDGAGANCAFGDSSPPCPPTGCQPPADTKVEFFFSDAATTGVSWYDVSLVDGYSLPMRIVPSGTQAGSCTATTCSLGLDRCPQDEAAGLGDLRVFAGGQAVACLSPCKRWNYPAPYGLGKPETQAPGIDMCCPTPPISSQQCRAGPVVTTKYVNLVRQSCPTAYSFAYDDLAGLHNCPTSTSFAVTICP